MYVTYPVTMPVNPVILSFTFWPSWIMFFSIGGVWLSPAREARVDLGWHRLQSRRAKGVGRRAQLLRLSFQLLRLLNAALGNIAVDFLEERPIAARLEKLIDCRDRGAAHQIGRASVRARRCPYV